MRPKERIPIFLQLIDWKFLSNRWGFIDNIGEKILHDRVINKTIINQWEDNPGMRFGQLLINLCMIPDNMRIWLDEEDDILKDQGIEPREFLLWGSIYDKDKNLLDEVKYRLIKDLETNHIENILKDFERSKAKLSPLFQETFEKELEMRKGKPKIVKVDSLNFNYPIEEFEIINPNE